MSEKEEYPYTEHPLLLVDEDKEIKAIVVQFGAETTMWLSVKEINLLIKNKQIIEEIEYG